MGRWHTVWKPPPSAVVLNTIIFSLIAFGLRVNCTHIPQRLRRFVAEAYASGLAGSDREMMVITLAPNPPPQKKKITKPKGVY